VIIREPAALPYLLTVSGLKTSFKTRDGIVKAVNGMDLRIKPGKTLGIVGESGCGKSVTALSVMRLIDQPGWIEAGEIVFEGRNLLKLGEDEMRKVRGNQIAMIFQEPMASLNPVYTIGNQIGEVLGVHKHLQGKAQRDRTIEMLRKVGIPAPEQRLSAYPHHLSGGMRQRVMIAMAMATDPKLLIADEPTTALDVTIQAQILDLMRGLVCELNTSVMLITHDLGVVAEMADDVTVMYTGAAVEHGSVYQVLKEARHPYTQGLLNSIPGAGMKGLRLNVIKGTVPNPLNLPMGCTFAPRCPHVMNVCLRQPPPLLNVGPQHLVRCWLYQQSEIKKPAEKDALPSGNVSIRVNTEPPRVSENNKTDVALSPLAKDTALPLENEAASQVLLDVRHLVKYYRVQDGLFSGSVAHLKAVDDVSFAIKRGEAFGLVGESGCGKTTTGRAILRLLPATSGAVFFEGQDILKLPLSALKPLRREMQIIFQDPYSSLNPRMPVGDIIGEGLRAQGMKNRKEREEHIQFYLKKVGLRPEYVRRYPHEFSGGQRQRIGIARALALRPKFVVCDEPVSALDVSIQSQVLNLLKDLQTEFGLTYLFIAHNLSVVEYISDRVGVMYLGKVVELAASQALYAHPRHPYTASLLSAIPIPDPTVRKERILLVGDVPSPLHPPSGCRFHTRCPLAQAICREVEPRLEDKTGGEHFAACHFSANVEDWLARSLR
jgi:peptide/nickel transport system ATP-binding protein